jgi:hypothetical protein
MRTTVVAFGFDQECTAFKDFKYRVQEAIQCYYASDVFDELRRTKQTTLEEALEKASKVLRVAQIPVQDHIRVIFRDQNHQIFRDWKISALACHLMKLNGDLENELVAKYQIALHQHVHKK